MANAVQQRLDIARAPEVALEARTPVLRNRQRIYQRPEQAQIAHADSEILQTGRAQCLNRQRQNFDIAFGLVGFAEQFDARLEELHRQAAFRFMAEDHAVVGNACGQRRNALDQTLGNGNGEVGP